MKRNITRIRNNVTADLWQLTDGPPVLHQENWTMKVVERLELFEKELVRCVKADGWDGSEDEGSVQWTLSGALFYSIIVITTIGKTISKQLFSAQLKTQRYCLYRLLVPTKLRSSQPSLTSAVYSYLDRIITVVHLILGIGLIQTPLRGVSREIAYISLGFMNP